MMNKNSAVRKITRNAGISILCKIIAMGFVLVDRFLFIKILGEQYLGINGLYSNILSVLSLADLGIYTVFLFFLYEPLVHKDEKRLATLVCFFRKTYRLIAAIVFLIGVSIIPFLHLLVNGVDLTPQELIGYYLLFVINTSCSYLAVYKSTILIADQSGYIANTINLVISISKCIIQIVILYFTKSYVLYLLAVILCTLINNLCLSIITGKRYPFLKKYDQNIDAKELKTKIFSNIRDVFLYRVGATIMNSTDNILISVLVGTVAVGHYSNYSFITTYITAILMIFSQAVMTAIGNYSVDAESEKKENAFRTVMLIYALIGTFVASCLIVMMNDFIILWIKDPNYVLSSFFVWCFAIKIYIDIINSPNWMFREAVGLFKEVRIVMFVAALINLLASIILGKIWGTAGIILATAAANIMTLFWFEPQIFYKKLFFKQVNLYWRYQSFLLLISAICIMTNYLIGNLLGISYFEMIVKIIICGMITICIFTAFCFNKKEFKLIISKIKRET